MQGFIVPAVFSRYDYISQAKYSASLFALIYLKLSLVTLRRIEMNTIRGIRFFAAILIVLNGVIHLALTAFSTTIEEVAVMALFGLLYVIIGIGLFLGRRLFSYLGVVLPLIGVCIGTYTYLTMKPETILLLLIAVDITVILCCLYLLFRKTPS